MRKIFKTMKHRVLALFLLLTAAACTERKSEDVAFEVARNYFFQHGQDIPASPKITSEEDFGRLFGMAAVMGKDGQPTAIDFSRQFVLALVLPVTDRDTEVTPLKVERRGNTLYYIYKVRTGARQSFSIQPMSIIILGREHADCEVVLNALHE